MVTANMPTWNRWIWTAGSSDSAAVDEPNTALRMARRRHEKQALSEGGRSLADRDNLIVEIFRYCSQEVPTVVQEFGTE